MDGPSGGLKGIFEEYELLVKNADLAFQMVAKDYESLVSCRSGCYDCCHAVFGIFLVESLYLGYHFQALDAKSRREAVLRAQEFERDLAVIQEKHPDEDSDSGDLDVSLARERVRCPLLGDAQLCLLYDHRPVTCRVYGIPTIIQGASHVCGKSGFTKGPSFPAFNLDLVNRELYRLSGKLIETIGFGSSEDASLLFSVSRSVNLTPVELTSPRHDAGGL